MPGIVSSRAPASTLAPPKSDAAPKVPAAPAEEYWPSPPAAARPKPLSERARGAETITEKIFYGMYGNKRHDVNDKSVFFFPEPDRNI